jgi:F-type H+-transporting ATPase subunit b
MSDFLNNPENWAALGFVVFIALVGRRAWTFITAWLDGRTAEIRARLDEAAKLREDAHALQASYERKQRDAEKEAEEIIAQAKDEAVRLTEDAAKALETSVERRRQLAIDRIGQAEAKALKEVRETAIDVAVRGARRLIEAQLDEEAADRMVDDAIRDLDKKLH